MRAVYDFFPMVDRPELKVLVDGTSQKMARALIHIESTGDMFWGHDLGTANSRVPQTMKNKLGILRETLSLVEDIEDDYHLDSWLKFERHATEHEIDILKRRKIGITLPPDIKNKFRKTPETALQAYQTPAIHDMVHQHLSFTGDPVVLIADGYADYERQLPQRDERARALGYSALEMFAFGAGGQPFIETVGAANLQFHQDELQRRSIKLQK
jgi:hypothetical protein